MKKEKFLTLVAFLFLGLNSFTQGLVINFNNGDTEVYTLSNLQSIKFDTDFMLVYENSGMVTSWQIDEIDHYLIDESLNLEELSPLAVNIYPNPATDKVTISYSSSSTSIESIIIIDAKGRVVEKLEGADSTSSSEIVWNANVDPGVYQVNIVTDKSTVSKQLIIQ